MTENTTPDVIGLCDLILADLHKLTAQTTELVRAVCTVRLDAASKQADSTPPDRARYVSPLGDRRERPVTCWGCGAPTFTWDSVCDPCFDRRVAAAEERDRAQGRAEDFRRDGAA